MAMYAELLLLLLLLLVTVVILLLYYIIFKVNYYTISAQICSFRSVVAMSLQQIMPRKEWPKCLKGNDCQKLREKG